MGMEYRLPDTGKEIEEKLANLFLNEKSYEQYFTIDYDGNISLKPEYRGAGDGSLPYSVSDNGAGVAGSLNYLLPNNLVIPGILNKIAVAELVPGMFYGNLRIKKLVLPELITTLPDRFCQYACNLEKVYNTVQITTLGQGVFAYTHIRELALPNLTSTAIQALAACGYLYSVDIGNNITTIPTGMFQQCSLLSCVKGGNSVNTIAGNAFYYTKNLKNLPLLSHVTSITGEKAFHRSRIQYDNWDSINIKGLIHAYPTQDNTNDYWSNCTYTPCEHRIVTKLSQGSDQWKNDTIGNTGHTYNSGCPYLTIMHIHSAISGRVYTDPRDFVNELDARYLEYETSPVQFDNVAATLQSLGYTTEVSANAFGEAITEEIYQTLCDALANGAYVYTQVTTPRTTAPYYDGGHAVMIYGINDIGEMLVLDSDITYDKYEATGFTEDTPFTYSIPYQNLTGPNSRYVIVYPPNN